MKHILDSMFFGEDMVVEFDKIWTYCECCMTRQDHHKIEGEWVCDLCYKINPLIKKNKLDMEEPDEFTEDHIVQSSPGSSL